MAKYNWPWGKCEPKKFEMKQSVGSGPPSAPLHYPADVLGVFGASYPAKPTPEMSADAVYKLALSARYFRWQPRRRRWRDVGGPGGWIRLLARAYHHEYRWPEPYPNPRTFARPDIYQVLPERELLRRHYDQKAYLFDYDLCLFDGQDYKTR